MLPTYLVPSYTKIPILFYVNTQGNILDYHIGTIEYADLLEITSRDK